MAYTNCSSVLQTTMDNDPDRMLESVTSDMSEHVFDNVTTSNVVTKPPIGPFEHYINEMPLYGYPGYVFWAIHGSAFVCLSASIIVSFTLIILLCISRRRTSNKEPGSTQTGLSNKAPSEAAIPPKPNPALKSREDSFTNWNIGERLVIYLAVCDLLFSISHLMDHGYIAYYRANPPDHLCSTFGFFLIEFVSAQYNLVFYTAISACSLVVFNHKINLGRRDWRLLLVSFGIPFGIGLVTASLGLLGQNGAMCYIDMRSKAGLIFAEIYGCSEIVFFITIAISYSAIFIKIRRTTKLIDVNAARYRKSAMMMTTFVFVFIFQWWSYILFTIWSLLGRPPAGIFILPVVTINLGGVYNAIAYTVIRRYFL